MTALADTSAWSLSERADAGAAAAEFYDAVGRGAIVTCDMVRLELLVKARNLSEFLWGAARLAELHDCPIAKPQWNRALWVYERLAAQGGAHQRSVGHADLLIAAAAESAGVTLLHYDEDYDRIAEITGQPTRWIAPRGSV